MTQEPIFSKCTEKRYEADPTTKNFPQEPDSNATVTSFEYDSLGRKTKDIEEYISGNYSSKSYTEWTYDSQGRLAQTTSGSIKDDNSIQISKKCLFSYDGTSTRVTRRACYDGETASESNLESTIDYTYDLALKKVSIIEKEIPYNDKSAGLQLTRKETEEHADTSFSFPINSTNEYYRYNKENKTNEQEYQSTLATNFSDNKYSSTTIDFYEFKNGRKLKRSAFSCEIISKKFNCELKSYNQNEELFGTRTIESKPLIIKYRSNDLLSCQSEFSCQASEFQPFGRITSSVWKAIEGKLDAEGKVPNKQVEYTSTYATPLRPWMIYDPTTRIEHTIDPEGKHIEEKQSIVESEDLMTLTQITQEREKNGTVGSREELGAFQNKSKRETVCVK